MERINFRNLDYSAIESENPSLKPNYFLVYKRECPIEIRIQNESNEEEVGFVEAIETKIFLDNENDATKKIKIELTSENDIFFHFVKVIDNASFAKLKSEQDLLVTFEKYPAVLIQSIDYCVNESEKHLAVLVIHKNQYSRLSLLKNLDYKFVELLNIDLVRSSEDAIKELLSYRYKAMKQKYIMTKAQLKEIKTSLKIKDPPRLKQLIEN